MCSPPGKPGPLAENPGENDKEKVAGKVAELNVVDRVGPAG